MVDRMVSERVGVPLGDDDELPARLGVICRYDEGGLGAQTWEYARHLRPDALLMVGMEEPRGEPRPERFTGLAPALFWTTHPSHDVLVWRRFLESVDVVLTAEALYLDDLPQLADELGVRVVVHANPELWPWHQRAPQALEAWAPTEWMVRSLPGGAPYMPVPVDRERCAPREVTEVRTLLHVSAPAMLDRNGTSMVKDALAFCRERFTLLVAGPDRPDHEFTIGGVTIRPVDRVDDYWRLYDDADALVLPRRYGGLCLPMQEAASCGLPIIAPLVAPQRQWLAPSLGLHEKLQTRARMKGGMVNVWRYAPQEIAARIDRLVSDDGVVAEGVKASQEWGAFLDWKAWEPVYDRALRAEGETR